MSPTWNMHIIGPSIIFIPFRTLDFLLLPPTVPGIAIPDGFSALEMLQFYITSYTSLTKQAYRKGELENTKTYFGGRFR